ncbi:PIF1-like helicase [Medicago truncatula]|uniref:PIF1-like helicase n=1 Tax=Medicago truncatula TaxID=3880 RepID=A0A072UHB2_MEDTR|nr:PIF1-like helicase [Medicago truncatula]
MRILHGARESEIEERKLFSDWILGIGDGTVWEINDVDINTPEFLSTIVASGLPNQKLRLKVGVPVMLLRNIDEFGIVQWN